MPNRQSRIVSLLQQFQPSLLRVDDDSHQHAGHAGAAPGGETHFSVLMVSEAFRGQSRIARSRAVHDALQSEFSTGLHALSLTLRTTDDHARIAATLV